MSSMERLGAVSISLALVACTAGSSLDRADTTTYVAAVEAPDAMLIDAPESLLHLSEGDLVDTMGEPEFIWVEADAQMWRYDAEGCALFVYLYPDGVRHVDMQGGGLDDSARSRCFSDMLADQT
ncbi:MAG: hypothetical protein CMM46_08790 [Rhodospirillaceae bacterium]|nr:hypothetical protein [Rhodospirillaceae bacterium]|tara:strand:- start:10148 stop:10519 length:372 start_codon:yes stop_codon:yes gene_type:complete